MEFPAIQNRHQFYYLLNYLYPQGIGVEVGVQCGEFSQELLNWNCSRLYLVDVWKQVDDYNDEQNFPNSRQQIHLIHTIARIPVNKWQNISILQLSSVQASKLFEDNSLDFVYIDANHDYEHVTQDISCWYPKVKHKGLLSGHDYSPYQPQVIEAVQASLRETIFHTNDADNFPSWYIFKGQQLR